MSTNSLVTSAPTSVPVSAPSNQQNSVLVDNAGVIVNSTTVDRTVGSVITAVSIIPYMRALAVDFVGYKLRPNRELWFYFDDVGINRFIQRPNIIELNTSNTVNDMRSGAQRDLVIGSSQARILHVEKSVNSGNAVFHVAEFQDAVVTKSGNTVTVDGASYTSSIKSYQHNSGYLRSNTTNTEVYFSADANGTTNDYYVGNTITILGGTDSGQSSEIINYNCITKVAYVNPPLKLNSKDTNLIYTIGDYRSWYIANTYPSAYTTGRGIVSGVFHIPDPNKNSLAKFKTGERVFTIVDNPFFVVNHPEFGQGNITTKAQYRFMSNGLDQSVAQIIERDTDLGVNIPLPTPTPTPSGTPRATPTPTATSVSRTPAITGTPTRTPGVTPTQTRTPAVTPTVTKTVGPTLTPTKTVNPSPTPTDTPNPSPTPTNIVMPGSPGPSPTPTKTVAPTLTPTSTIDPSPTPTDTPPVTLTMTPTPGVTPTMTQTPPKTSPPPTPTGTMTATPPVTPPRTSPPPSKSRACTPKYQTVIIKDLGAQQQCISCCPPPTLGGGKGDPIAETFFVSAAQYPDGMFVSSVDLFFKNRGEQLPVEVQIRPVVDGYPSSDKIIPGATSTVDFDDIKISNFPNVSNSMTATRFTFPSPVYLSPSYEYAIVAETDDFGYDYYSSELGGTVIGSDQKISKQPTLGSFFKSQSGTTWTALQNEDLMFVLNRANFTASTGTAIFDENKTELFKEISSNVAYNGFDSLKANSYYDSFELRSDAIELNNTRLKYYFKGVANSSATKVLDSAYINFSADKKFDLERRNVLFNPQLKNKSMTVRVDMETKSDKVSPIIYQNRQNMVVIENLINDTGLTADRFVITDPGMDYDQDNAYITITSTVGYGANAWAVSDPQTGNIVSIVVDSPGVGYVDDVTATIGGGAGTGATLDVSTETGSSGGPAIARYISKTITLLDGFDAGDLRVFMTAVKPPGANVNIYYKVRNSLDPDPIEERNWVRMTQKTSQYTFSVNRNPVEYEYRPSLTSNNITYSTDTTTYKTFNQFAIKIVLSSRSTVANGIPYIYDVRAIALPEDAY